MRSKAELKRPWTPKDARVERPEPKGLLGVAWRFFARTAWTGEHARRSGLRGLWWRCVRVAYLATSGFQRDQCLFRASALTYTTVLSLVPLLALTFAVAKGFGFYDDLRHDTIDPFLDSTFGPLDQLGPEITSEQAHAARSTLDQVLNLVDQTDVKLLGWSGLALVLLTAIKLLSSIELSLNEIWGAQRARSWIRKLADYLAMLVVAPLALFIATGVTTAAKSTTFYAAISKHEQFGWLLQGLLRLAPVLTLWLGFSFVYLALPNARTRLGSALLGAFVGATLWQVMLLLHLEFQIGIARYNPIYSSFAALPVFLIWLNFSWVAVLLGAEVCNAHQSEPSCQFPVETGEESQSARELIALRAAGRIGAAFLSAGAPWTVERLAADMSTTTRSTSEVLEALVRAGLLVETQGANEYEYLPARELELITVQSILEALRGARGFDAHSAPAPIDQRIGKLLADIDHEFRDSRHNRTLRALAEATLRAQGAEHPRTEPGTSVAPSAS